MGEQVRARNLDSWVERHGHGPAVPIIAELAIPWRPGSSSWTSCRTATGSPPITPARWGARVSQRNPLTVLAAAEDAAALLAALEIPAAPVVRQGAVLWPGTRPAESRTGLQPGCWRFATKSPRRSAERPSRQARQSIG
jgi:hypothetical protein